MCMYACLTTLGHTPNEMKEISQIWTKASLSLRYNLAALNGLKHNIPEVFNWI